MIASQLALPVAENEQNKDRWKCWECVGNKSLNRDMKFY